MADHSGSDSDEPATKKSKTDDTASTSALPMCPYGAKCYRKNPVHFKEFVHPKKGADKHDKPDKTVQIDTSKLPACSFGTGCYRKNLLHFAQYSHPVTGKVDPDIPDDGSGSDTDVYNSDEEEDKEKKSGVPLGRASSLVKKYSQLTEEERLDLIKRAFEMKEQLEKELEETKAEVDAKVKELKSLQAEVTKGALLLEGEQEALDSGKIKYFDLMPERSYKEGSAAQLHFRLAESQFYRLLSGPGGAGYQVKKVQYVVNPKLVKQFKKSREKLIKTRGEQHSYPVLAFHGTQVANITPICEGGFKCPGEDGFKHRTDTGFYGCGAYFSEFPGFSIGYIQGATKLLLCQILTGKVFQCTKMIQGSPLKDGYDSHRSPSKKELVIFSSKHILPCYIVHYKQTQGEFKYITPPEEQRKVTSKEDLMKLYWKAKKKRKANIFSGKHIRFCGGLCDDEDSLGQLVVKHGGMYVDNVKPSAATMGTTRGRGRGRGGAGAFGGGLFAPAPPTPPFIPGTLGWVYFEAKYIKNFNLLVTTEKDFKKKTKPDPVRFLQAHGLTVTVPTVREEWLYESIIDGELKDTEEYELED